MLLQSLFYMTSNKSQRFHSLTNDLPTVALRPTCCCSLRQQKKTLRIGQDVTVCRAPRLQEMNLSLRKNWKHGSVCECVRVPAQD